MVSEGSGAAELITHLVCSLTHINHPSLPMRVGDVRRVIRNTIAIRPGVDDIARSPMFHPEGKPPPDPVEATFVRRELHVDARLCHLARSDLRSDLADLICAAAYCPTA
jgi:hypothetical protein|eukprot:COSAG01_NODE_7292_length_3265_cov_15.785850_3_plen_109_part_00